MLMNAVFEKAFNLFGCKGNDQVDNDQLMGNGFYRIKNALR